jgi:regulator of cell morphogenesis and NO signaling
VLVTKLTEELFVHLLKEEKVLFPSIQSLIEGRPLQFEKSHIAHPIQAMEFEHEHAGEILHEIQKLTNNFSPPEYACTTWKICYSTLDEYVKDLHTHIHLENNVLFPEVIKMISHQ